MKLLLSILASCISFFLPVQGILIAVGVAIALDTMTGIYKAKKLGGWKAVTSRSMSDVVGKMLLYNLGVLSIFIIDKSILSEFMEMWFSVDFFFTKIVALVLIVIELKSVRENFEAAFKQDIFQLLKDMLKRTKELKDDVVDIAGKENL